MARRSRGWESDRGLRTPRSPVKHISGIDVNISVGSDSQMHVPTFHYPVAGMIFPQIINEPSNSTSLVDRCKLSFDARPSMRERVRLHAQAR